MPGANELRMIVALFVGGLVGLLCGHFAGEWLLIQEPAMGWRRFAVLTYSVALLTGAIAFGVALYVVS